MGRPLGSNQPVTTAGGSGSMTVDSRAAAGQDIPFQPQLDKYGMPTHYITDSGAKIPGYLFPGQGSGRGTSGGALRRYLEERGELVAELILDGAAMLLIAAPAAAATPTTPAA